MALKMTDSKELIEKEKLRLEVQKHCDVFDAGNAFWLEMNQKYGPDFEANFSWAFDKHFKTKATRNIFVRKWEIVIKRAKNRMVSRGKVNNIP